MSESSKPQYAAVEYPFPLAETPVIHCPICGQGTYKVQQDGSSEMTPCEHLTFIYFNDQGIFAYKNIDFTERIRDRDLDDLSFENFEEFLEEIGYDNKMLAIEATSGGMADNGGRSWRTDIYGFDYNTI
jgi:hypothetical protein